MHDHVPGLAKSLRVSIVVITLSLVMSKWVCYAVASGQIACTWVHAMSDFIPHDGKLSKQLPSILYNNMPNKYRIDMHDIVQSCLHMNMF